MRTPATLVWGGDGHNHWHVQRVAINRLVSRLGKDGRPVPGAKGWPDAKIGFCYYDGIRQADDAAQDAVYSRYSCGSSTSDTAVGMGLSAGAGATSIRSCSRARASTSRTCPTAATGLRVEVDDPQMVPRDASRRQRHLDRSHARDDVERARRVLRNVKQGPSIPDNPYVH